MERSSHRRPAFVALLLAAAAGGLMLLPRTAVLPVKSAVRDSVLPGQRLAQSIQHGVQSLVDQALHSAPYEENSPGDASALSAGTSRIRALQIENARLQQRVGELSRLAALPIAGEPSEPLIVPELVDATVMGAESAERWRSGRLLDRGAGAGIDEIQLVLEGDGILLDQGRDRGLDVGLPIYAGRAVVGRIAAAGHWSSTVQLVTDAEYRGLAQFIRPTHDGYSMGAQGKLEGMGDGRLRMTHVPATEPVNVGDDVYTADRDPALPYPMYYGKVVAAELQPGGLHWEILIEPAARLDDLETVQVLRRGLNPARLMAQ